MSRTKTSWPSSAKHAAVTSPTHPAPMTPIGGLVPTSGADWRVAARPSLIVSPPVTLLDSIERTPTTSARVHSVVERSSSYNSPDGPVAPSPFGWSAAAERQVRLGGD